MTSLLNYKAIQWRPLFEATKSTRQCWLQLLDKSCCASTSTVHIRALPEELINAHGIYHAPQHGQTDIHRRCLQNHETRESFLTKDSHYTDYADFVGTSCDLGFSSNLKCACAFVRPHLFACNCGKEIFTVCPWHKMGKSFCAHGTFCETIVLHFALHL